MPIYVIHSVEYMAKKLNHTQDLVFHNRMIDFIEDEIGVNHNTEGYALNIPPLLMNKEDAHNAEQLVYDSDKEHNNGPPPFFLSWR